jgi:hypothetical protein
VSVIKAVQNNTICNKRNKKQTKQKTIWQQKGGRGININEVPGEKP